MNDHSWTASDTVAEVGVLDPELLSRPDTRLLVALAAGISQEVTQRYGTPTAPLWAWGTYQTNVFMAYHNGGADGHTSVGPHGAGVPRGVLVIAGKVNEAAGAEVFDPVERAAAFYAACAHDLHQLCGRALLPEGQRRSRGDERLSANVARRHYLARGGDDDVAALIHRYVMATAFDPHTTSQNVDYAAPLQRRQHGGLNDAVLGQELITAADLWSATTSRCPVSSIEHTVERLCWIAEDRVLTSRLQDLGIDRTTVTTMEQLLTIIGDDPMLASIFRDAMADEPRFYGDLWKYSDGAIRAACGQGIDELFPGRLANAATLERLNDALQAGTHPRDLWHQARQRAGYADPPDPADTAAPAGTAAAQRPFAPPPLAASSPPTAHLAAASESLQLVAALATAQMAAIKNHVHSLSRSRSAPPALMPPPVAAALNTMIIAIQDGQETLIEAIEKERRRLDDVADR